MEQDEKISDSNGLSVATTNYISGNKDSKKSVEDTNCNLTILTSEDKNISVHTNLIQTCEQGLRELSINGPTSKLSNGIENVHFPDNCCSIAKSNSKDVSSQCTTCENAHESFTDKADNTSLQSPQLNSGHSVKLDSLDDKVCNEVSNCESKPDIAETKEENGSACGGIVGALELSTVNAEPTKENEIFYVSYESELQMPDIMRLIQKDLSEPYSIYTYRYFIHNWPHLCFLAMDGSTCVGAIVCKLDMHRKVVRRGYIAMLAVDEKYRKKKIGSNLVLKAIRAMVTDGADEVVLETEITNKPALRLYENLGFVRDKRLFRYYLNGVDALRLKLWLR